MSLASHRLAVRSVVVGAALGLLVAAVPGAANASTPGQNGRIAFDERGAIFTIKPDGSGVKQLTAGTTASPDRMPSWSPDGKLIAFDRDGDLWLMRADGSHQRQLTSGPGYDTEPDWSPDGTKLVFVRAVGRDNYVGRTMLVKPVAGGLPTALTSTPIPGCPIAPTWTPDNKFVVFDTSCGHEAVLKLNRSTGAITAVVPETGLAGPGGTWELEGTTSDVTPDSKNVVFTVRDPTGNQTWIGITDLSGGGFRRIAGYAEAGVFLQDDPSVSPDGRTVVYAIGNENPRIATAKVARSDQLPTELYGDGFYALHFDWQARP